ncbi:MAG: hypothetical protein H0U27_10555 [Nitrosopumilus sp.]|nr:hypothetical protein [Nitrosopumilus sp.]
MANIENIFRFISLRPTKQERTKGRLNMHIYKQDSRSDFYVELQKKASAGSSKEELSRIGESYQKSARYVKDFKEIKFPTGAMLDWISNNGQTSFKNSEFIKHLLEIANINSLEDLIKDNEFNSTYNNLSDSVLADILTGSPVEEKEEKITAIKVLYTLKSVGEKTLSLEEDELINNFFGRSTVIFPFLKASPARDQPEKPQPNPVDDQKEKENLRKKEYLDNLEKAHRELSIMSTDDKYRYKPEENVSENTRLKDLENQVTRLINQSKENNESKMISAASSGGSFIHPAQQEFILANKAFDLLSDNTKKILGEFNFEHGKINPARAVGRIEDEIRYIHAGSATDFAYNKMIPLGGTYVDKQKFTASLSGMFNTAGTAIGAIIKKCSFKAGLGDLLIVRQTLKAYELAEFAHVENALVGEFRKEYTNALTLQK